MLDARFDGRAVGRLFGLLCAGALLALTFSAGSAEAAKRVALLIGNAKYESTSPLINPANDVDLMKASFEQAGFDSVTTIHDVGRQDMVKALRDFEDLATGAEVAIIYYSGHGMEMSGQNYLLPVDVSLKTDKDVEDEAIPLSRVERTLEGASRLKLVILDACRNNPFEQSMTRSISTRAVTRGLARVEPEAADLLVAFASKAGTVALDGEGNNSPFAAALAKYLTEPGVDVRIALGKVRDEVVSVTNRGQEPFVYGSLGGAQIFLNIEEVNITVNTREAETVSPNGQSAAAADWQNIRDLADQELIEVFLQQHGNDPVYRLLAEKKLKLLAKAEADNEVKPDDIAWEALQQSTDAAALTRFIERYPDSRHKSEAETLIAALRPETGDYNTGTGPAAGAAGDCYLLAGEPQSMPGFNGVNFLRIDAERALTACAQAVNENPEDMMLVNLLGRAQDAARNYVDARATYQKAADGGNLWALTNLGWFSVYGTDGPVDVEAGKALFEQGANAGNAYAQASLGYLYREGYGGSRKDLNEALKWYRLSADQGYANAEATLGLFYRDGLGVAVDYTQSLAWYQKAADHADTSAMSALGWAYQNGLGTAQDYVVAKEWYEKAANAGDSYSMAVLGWFYDAGNGVAQDYAQALSWYEQAANAGSAYAMGNLSRLYDYGLGTKVDAREAARWAAASVEGGDPAKLEELKSQPNNFTPDFRKEMQALLKDRGLYAGPIDGDFGASTQSAILRLANKQ